MKKVILVLVLGVFMIGCGAREEAKVEQQAAEPKQDYVAMGIMHLQEGDPQAAIVSFDEAIKNDPLNPQSYIILGQTYLRMGNFDRAVDSFSAGTRIAPRRGELHYLLAVAHGQAGNTNEAIQSAQRSAEMFQQAQDPENFAQAVSLVQLLMQSTQGSKAELNETDVAENISPEN